MIISCSWKPLRRAHINNNKGLQIAYAVHDTPFGTAFIAITARGICRLAFVEDEGIALQLAQLRQAWPDADMRENLKETQAIIDKMFARPMPHRHPAPISLYVTGTNFQVSVWKALLQIEPGRVTSYANIAHAIGHPHAARAVGLAAGANPVAFLIPCHRVILQSGRLGGYRWGEVRKHALHAWESARQDR